MNPDVGSRLGWEEKKYWKGGLLLLRYVAALKEAFVLDGVVEEEGIRVNEMNLFLFKTKNDPLVRT